MREYDEGLGSNRVVGKRTASAEAARDRSGRNDVGNNYTARKPVTVGWTRVDADARPGTVLDPFAGTGTAGEVALKFGRSFVGFELCADYANVTRNRCAAVMEWLAQNHVDPRAVMR